MLRPSEDRRHVCLHGALSAEPGWNLMSRCLQDWQSIPEGGQTLCLSLGQRICEAGLKLIAQLSLMFSIRLHIQRLLKSLPFTSKIILSQPIWVKGSRSWACERSTHACHACKVSFGELPIVCGIPMQAICFESIDLHLQVYLHPRVMRHAVCACAHKGIGWLESWTERSEHEKLENLRQRP